MSIDILRKLREAHVPDEQAEAIAEAIETRIRPPDMASKADIAELKADLNKQIGEVQRNVLLATFAAVSVLFALLKLFPPT